MKLTTLCYLEKDDAWLMMHRVLKENDPNEGKWIGLGGHFLDGESPEECVDREVREECGAELTSRRFRGIVTFCSDKWETEYMFLYTADDWRGDMTLRSDEGILEWVPKSKVDELPLWEGDHIFLKLINEDIPPFSLKLVYTGEKLTSASLDGRPLPIS